jgi:hypothetical protein
LIESNICFYQYCFQEENNFASKEILFASRVTVACFREHASTIGYFYDIIIVSNRE